MEIDKEFGLPFKSALFTCNHVLDDEYFSNYNYIYIINQFNKDFKINIVNSNIYTISKYEYQENKAKKGRKIFSESFDFDYTCIELLDNDLNEIKPLKFFKIDKKFLADIKNNNDKRKIEKDIYLLHYSKGEDLSFSLGVISNMKNQNFHHTASTLRGASGSPILRRNNNCVIGLHWGGIYNYNFGLFIDDILSNIKENYNKINTLASIVRELKKRNLIRDSNYSYVKEKEEEIKKGECGKIYYARDKNNDNNVLMITIHLLKLIPFLCMKYYYDSLIEHAVEQIEREIQIIKDINYGKFLDIYIECNCFYITIENNCNTEFPRYIETEKNIKMDEIKSLLYVFNEEICFYCHNIDESNIDESNILINTKDKKYKLLFYYDALISGEKYKNSSKIKNESFLSIIGNFLEKLLKKKYYKEAEEADNLCKTYIPYNIYKKKNSFFLFKILEKINSKLISWNDYYFECKYNILNVRQKKIYM